MRVSLPAWVFTSQLWLLLVVIYSLLLSGGVLKTVMQSSISKSISREEIGGNMGISTWLDAIYWVVAPSCRIVIPTRRASLQAKTGGGHE